MVNKMGLHKDFGELDQTAGYNGFEFKDSDKFLSIIKEIEKNPSITQRELSGMLGISLGKVNFLLKSLINKGIIKAKNFKNSRNKFAYMYLLTPRGIEEKARITYRFLKIKSEEYERLRREIDDLKRELAAFKDGRDNIMGMPNGRSK